MIRKNLTSFILFAIVAIAFLLRFYDLGKVPLSLYWDEASLGYNAYSIATTVKDEHGESFPIARFQAFGDYKPPGYIYITAFTVKLLGLSEFSTRLPSAIAGLLLVLATYYLVREFSYYEKSSSRNYGQLVALLSAFLISVSPWAIQFSRSAFEANLATMFSSLGILFFLYSLRTRSLFASVASSLFLGASIYTFNSHRVFIPIIMAILSIVFFWRSRSNSKILVTFWVAFVLSVSPLIPYFLTPESRLRFQEVAWINDSEIIIKSNDAIKAYGNNQLSNIIFNRRTFYLIEFSKHYLDNFRFDYLFLNGDVNPRLSIRSVGELYIAEAVGLLLGVYYHLRRRNLASLVIFSWLFIGLIPASLARETPHSLRSFNVFPIPSIILGFGLLETWKIIKKRVSLQLIVSIIYIVLVGKYLFDYYYIYPYKYQMDWQYGYKQMVEYISSVQSKYDSVNITDYYGRPYIYFLYYLKYSPKEYLATRKAEKDIFGFWNVSSFDKYYFNTSLHSGKSIYVLSASETISGGKLIRKINSTYNKPIFLIYEK